MSILIDKHHYWTESTTCLNCGKVIKWESVETGNIWGKLKYHQNNDKECIREGKLKELLDDDLEKLNI